MTRPDYSGFDAELLAMIGGGINTFAQLQAHQMLFDATKPFCALSKSPSGTPPWRIIDRRLQALRKAGRIAYSGGKWHITK